MASINKTNKWFILIGTILIISSIILTIWFFMRGQTTVTGNYLQNERSISISCKNERIEYPFFSYINTNNKKMTINLIFNDEHMQSASLTYELMFTNESDATKSETINRASMNKAIAAFGLNGILSPNYSYNSTSMHMNLYVSKTDFEKAKKFLLLDNTDSDIKTIIKSYENLGFACINNN